MSMGLRSTCRPSSPIGPRVPVIDLTHKGEWEQFVSSSVSNNSLLTGKNAGQTAPTPVFVDPTKLDTFIVKC